MNYRIVEYVCHCKYLWLDGGKRFPKCPVHKQVQKKITLFCKTCGVKVVTTPLAGRRMRCFECSAYKNKKSVKKRAQQIYNEKHGIETELTAESLGEKDERQLKEWFIKLQTRFKPQELAI